MLEAQVATHYVRSARLGELEARLQGLGERARDLGEVKALLDAFQACALAPEPLCNCAPKLWQPQ